MAETGAWMPLYIGDYRADTAHLGMAEHGAYLLLIMHYWRTGPLPNDDKALARIVQAERKEWAEVASAVRAFFTVSEGRLHHKRIDRELASASASHEQRKAAARARWDKAQANRISEDNPGEDADADASASEPHMKGISQSLSPSPRKEDSVSLRSTRDAKDILFSEGRQFIAEVTGKSADSLRGTVGKLINDAGGDCSVVLGAIEAAKLERPVEPIAWLRRACQQRNPGRKTDLDLMAEDLKLTSLDDSLDDAIRERDEEAKRRALR